MYNICFCVLYTHRSYIFFNIKYDYRALNFRKKKKKIDLFQNTR